MNRARRNRRLHTGQALVESALVVLVFLGMMIATLDFAQVLFVHQSMVDRVRSGLRWAAMHPYNETNIKNMVRYNQPTPPDGASPFMGLTAANVTVTMADSGAPTERIQIAIVDYSYYFLSPWIAKAFTNNAAVVESLPTEYRP